MKTDSEILRKIADSIYTSPKRKIALRRIASKLQQQEVITESELVSLMKRHSVFNQHNDKIIYYRDWNSLAKAIISKLKGNG